MPIYKDGKTKNADGLQRYKVRINYADSLGNHRQLTRVAYGLQEAKMLEMKLQNERKEPSLTFTIDFLYSLYYNAKKYLVRETTLAKTHVAFRVHILPFWDDTKIAKVTVQAIQKWKQYINDKSLNVRTNKNIYAEFRAFLNWCVKNGYISENPINKVDNFRNAYETPEKDKLQYYTINQFKDYINAALTHAEHTQNYNYYVFFMIAFYTGMRKGEINALKWSDIQGDKIHVRRSIAQKLKGEDRETPPKNKSSYRTLQAPLTLLKVLECQMIRHQQISANISDLRVCGGFKPLRDTTIDKYNRQYSTTAGLPHIKIHSFRHSHATVLANAGINIQEIARRLGHSNVQETWNTYSHLYPQEEERAVQVLDNI